MARIELLGVSKRYGELSVLDDVSLVVEDNEFLCIFGPPTSGKTTLLRLMLGLETPDRGEILINGRRVTRAGTADRNLAMVFQNLALFPHLSACQNMRFPLVQQRIPVDAIASRVDAVAKKLRIGHLLHKLPGQLSGGERQRVAIGRALVRDPEAYLMDDPISALDARLREEMRIELKRLQRELGKTLIYVTHDQEEAMSVADRIAILDGGRLQQVDTPRQIYREPNNRLVARLLGQPAMNFLPGTIDERGMFHAQGCAWTFAEPAIDVKPGAIELGFRPERARIAKQDDLEAALVRVHECEPLGAQTVLTLQAGERLFKVALQGQHSYVTGAPLRLGLASKDRLYFDPTSGRRLRGILPH